jgi:hypothetical protein
MRTIILLNLIAFTGCGEAAKAPDTVPAYETSPQGNTPGPAPKNKGTLKVGFGIQFAPSAAMAASIARTVFSTSASECSAEVIPA